MICSVMYLFNAINWRSGNAVTQKSFYFSATVANLQAKVESLTTTNALMKEDLAISKNTMIQLVEENNQLKHALGEWSEQLTKHFH